MVKVEENGVPYYQFESLAAIPGIFHGCFTRHGGTSPPPFSSLNVGFGLGDADGNVRANRRLIRRCFPARRLHFARQVHRTRVLVVDGEAVGEDAPEPRPADTGDAMITDRAECGLVIQVADCQAVLLADPRRCVVAAVHAGWRGSVRNILGSTVAEMTRRFGCRPADMVAGIGPSLGPCCAEFVNYRREIPEALWPYKDAHDRFDFWSVSVRQLCRAGLREDAIEKSGLCTRCRTDLFYSYRGEKTTGRMAAVIGRVV